VGELHRSYGLLTNLQMVIVGRLKTGKTADVPELINIQDGIQRNLKQLRQLMDQNIRNLTTRAARSAEARDQKVLEVTTITTSLAITFGLVFAWLMARRMVQPVEALMSGVRSVERGDLKTRLAVQSTDEIGALTTSFNKLVDELRAQAQLKETFGKYVDPRIVESVMLNPSLAETEGGKRVMTISFSDLVGFTGLGEELAPATLVRLLNRHFGLMAEAIQGSQGVVDKLIGDAVMAFWGPPFAKAADHATLACRAALLQLKVLERFRTELPDLTGLRKHPPVIDLRIGLASGDAVVGNIGSEKLRSYTVIGDTVNLASRLEGVNRVYGTRILMNSETRLLAGTTIETREIDWIAVKGKSEQAAVYELIGAAGETPTETLALRDRYEECLAAYRRRDFEAASTGLQAVLALASEDGPSKLLLTRVRQMQAQPPAADWDGVWHLVEK
jgi:adenylate cyclase